MYGKSARPNLSRHKARYISNDSTYMHEIFSQWTIHTQNILTESTSFSFYKNIFFIWSYELSGTDQSIDSGTIDSLSLQNASANSYSTITKIISLFKWWTRIPKSINIDNPLWLKINSKIALNRPTIFCCLGCLLIFVELPRCKSLRSICSETTFFWNHSLQKKFSDDKEYFHKSHLYFWNNFEIHQVLR